MKYIADLHIHSHFSRATSGLLRPEHLDYYAGLKGIKVVGTGDFTHPGWLDELKEKTYPDGNGFLKLKKDYSVDSPFGSDTRFILTAEISNIYKRDGRVRKVHNLILVKDFLEAEKINRRLKNIGGNLTSDGRPILGLDSRDLLEIVLDCSEDNYFIPAHIWTPWFSMLGSKSGFDSIDECFADLSGHIHTIETGLSTDPPMNWLCSFLDRVTLVSNSDAHSPEKLGRNANIFNTNLDYYSLVDAMRTVNSENFGGTIDMFPQEGKYHYDGHRKCQICWDPAETLKNDYLCPVCKKPVTVGVMNRIIHLSDRDDIDTHPRRHPFWSIIPLKELLSEITGTGANSVKVEKEYMQTIRKLGPELDILLEIPLEKLEAECSKVFAEAIRRMRNRQVIIKEGYDGEYGEIKVFGPGDVKFFNESNPLFRIDLPSPPVKRKLINFDLESIQALLKSTGNEIAIAAEKLQPYGPLSNNNLPFQELNPQQHAAVVNEEGHTLIIAGPGTGKTKTLISKIAWLLANKIADPGEILTITFTNKAAEELSARLQIIQGKQSLSKGVVAATFHAFGLSVLKKFHDDFGRSGNFILADEIMKTDVVKSLSGTNEGEVKKLVKQISDIKSGNESESVFFRKYEEALKKLDIFDLDDLIVKPLKLFRENETIRNFYQNRYRYIFVDEFQDINDNQYKLIQLLAPSEKSHVCVVGDANQSIYGFRGSGSDFIDRFITDYPGAKMFRLTKSYRCSQAILDASSGVLDHSAGFLEGSGEGLRILISEQPSGAAEGEFIARQIVKLTGGVSFFSIDSDVSDGNRSDLISSLSGIAVLCRTRNQFEPIAKALRDHNLPYQEVGTIPFFREEPYRTLISFLRLIAADRFEHADKLLSFKNDFISNTGLKDISDKKNKLGLVTFLELIREQVFKNKDFTPESWIRFTGIAGSISNLNDFLDYLAVGTGPDTHDYKMEAISLMTLHASKGLEFECVFISGCEDGLIPYSLYNTPTNPEEEKRLLYVGMTRAKRLLYMTYARHRMYRGRRLSLPLSPFVKNVQQDLLQNIKYSPPQKKQEKDDQLRLF